MYTIIRSDDATLRTLFSLCCASLERGRVFRPPQGTCVPCACAKETFLRGIR